MRAAQALAARRRRENLVRTAVGLVLFGLAILVPAGAEPVTGDPGATVGGVVTAILFMTLAVAVWPQPWSPGEAQHRELDAIWHEVRTDADEEVAWPRFAGWVQADGERLRLQMLRRDPAANGLGGAPSPYLREDVRRIAADDIELATAAMEQLRTDAQAREESARRDLDDQNTRAERVAHERALQNIDDASAAEIRAREEELKQEMAAQDAAERRAQAAAVARSLRRP